jgi:hypothetical protein
MYHLPIRLRLLLLSISVLGIVMLPLLILVLVRPPSPSYALAVILGSIWILSLAALLARAAIHQLRNPTWTIAVEDLAIASSVVESLKSILNRRGYRYVSRAEPGRQVIVIEEPFRAEVEALSRSIQYRLRPRIYGLRPIAAFGRPALLRIPRRGNALLRVKPDIKSSPREFRVLISESLRDAGLRREAEEWLP